MAGATLATLLTRLRTDLQDATAAIWTDAELTSHVDRAVREFSHRIPRERVSALTTTANSRTIDVSSLTDRIAVIAVEWPTGRFPKVYQPFSDFGGTLELTGPDRPSAVEAVDVYWLGPHTLDGSTSTVPVHLEDLVLLGAGAYALLDQAAQTVNSVATGGVGARAAYRELGAARLDRFQQEIERAGRRNRVRVQHLYTPALPIRSRESDPGP